VASMCMGIDVFIKSTFNVVDVEQICQIFVALPSAYV